MFIRQGKLIAILFLAFIIAVLAGCHGGEHGEREQKGEHPARINQQQIDPQLLERLKELDATADRMYQDILSGRLVEAREHIRSLSDQITEIEFSGIASVEGVQALTTAVVTAKELLNAIHQAEPERLQIVAAQVRLAADALIHSQHPLWHDYDKRIDADMMQLREAIDSGSQVLSSAQQLYRTYSIIRPAVLITHPPEITVRIESLLAFFIQQANHPDAGLIESYQELSRTWAELFGHSHVSAYMSLGEGSQPIYWSLVIGSIIITVLIFTAWRKYEGENRVKTAYGPRRP